MPDERRMLPLDALKEAPWNPKVPIAGVYRKGLQSSLDHFGIRDELKIWPDPDEPGTYFVLDGNQRLGVLRESEVEAVECRILADLDEDDARLFTASFDRSHARYDEAKLADLASGLGSIDGDLIASILRPGTATIAPPPIDDVPDVEAAPAPARPTIPVMFELTPEGYARVMAGVLKAKSRLVREGRLARAVESLSGRRLDDGIVELALRIFAV